MDVGEMSIIVLSEETLEQISEWTGLAVYVLKSQLMSDYETNCQSAYVFTRVR